MRKIIEERTFRNANHYNQGEIPTMKYKSKYKLAPFVLLLANAQAFSAVYTTDLAPANISYFANHTTKNSTTSSNIAIIVTSSFQGGCTKGGFIDTKADAATYSLIMAGYFAERTLSVSYDNAQISPWGDAARCAITQVGIKPK